MRDVSEIWRRGAIPIEIIYWAIKGIDNADQCGAATSYDLRVRDALKTVHEWPDAPTYIDELIASERAEIETKRGHWIEGIEAMKFDGVLGDDYIVCSECRKPFCTIENCTEEFNFCPHCGANMVDAERGGTD